MIKKEFVQAMSDFAGKFGEIKVEMVERTDKKYTGMSVRKIGVPVPVVNLDKLYEDYKNEVLTLDDCYDLIDRIMGKELEVQFDMSKITDWSTVIPFVRMRVTEEEPNGIYDKFGGLYMCPYIDVSEGYAVKITQELIDMWDITKETLFETAAINTILHQ